MCSSYGLSNTQTLWTKLINYKEFVIIATIPTGQTKVQTQKKTTLSDKFPGAWNSLKGSLPLIEISISGKA